MSGPTVHLDFETRSACDLKKLGLHRYAHDPSTEVICASWRFDDGPVQRWKIGEPPLFLNPLIDHIASGGQVIAHNAAFERAMWNTVLPRQLGLLPELRPEQQDCTQARGQAMGLPASLEALGAAVKADVQKDKEGHRLMLRMCKPKSIDDSGHVTWHEKPEDVARLQDYCDLDVLSECSVDARVPRLSDRERRIWLLNQRFNDRGVLIDIPMAAKAQAVVDYARKAADERMWRLTNGAVTTCNQTARIVAWLSSRGIPCTSVADGQTEELLAGAEVFDDAVAEQVINLRRSSVKAFKFETMLAAACPDGRVRGTIAYHGAHTGRDAGRIIQPQNMKRLDDDAGDPETVRIALEILRASVSAEQAYEALDMITGDTLNALSVMARSMIIAARGRRLLGGDFSNIEGRLAAWFADARWKLDAFRAYDAGTGPDLYKVTASRVLGKPVEQITKTERQVTGKVTELACGYQGMLNALKKMAAKQKAKVADAELLAAGRGWRMQNPEIVGCWRELEDAVIDAVSNPGAVVPVMNDRVRYMVQGDFLYCRLPGQRIIAYAQPRVSWTRKTIKTEDGDEVEINKRSVSYWGTHQGRFMRLDLYGGAEFNHVVQGAARDVLYDAALRVEAAGYPIILPVHDELLTEPDDRFGAVSEFEGLMSEGEAWHAGLPLVTKAWEDARYTK
jgi:DNA polymerase